MHFCDSSRRTVDVSLYEASTCFHVTVDIFIMVSSELKSSSGAAAASPAPPHTDAVCDLCWLSGMQLQDRRWTCTRRRCVTQHVKVDVRELWRRRDEWFPASLLQSGGKLCAWLFPKKAAGLQLPAGLYCLSHFLFPVCAALIVVWPAKRKPVFWLLTEDRTQCSYRKSCYCCPPSTHPPVKGTGHQFQGHVHHGKPHLKSDWSMICYIASERWSFWRTLEMHQFWICANKQHKAIREASYHRWNSMFIRRWAGPVVIMHLEERVGPLRELWRKNSFSLAILQKYEF